MGLAPKTSVYLRGLSTPGRYDANVYKRDKFCDFLFVFLHTKPLLNRSLLEKERICSHSEQILCSHREQIHSF